MGASGRLPSWQVEQAAQDLGVSARTVWRWVAQASGRAQPPVLPRFAVDDHVRRLLERRRGNVAAVHQDLVDAAAAGGAPAPSLATLHRAVGPGPDASGAGEVPRRYARSPDGLRSRATRSRSGHHPRRPGGAVTPGQGVGRQPVLRDRQGPGQRAPGANGRRPGGPDDRGGLLPARPAPVGHRAGGGGGSVPAPGCGLRRSVATGPAGRRWAQPGRITGTGPRRTATEAGRVHRPLLLPR